MRLIELEDIERVSFWVEDTNGLGDFKAVEMDDIYELPRNQAIPIEWLEEEAEDTPFQHRVKMLIDRFRKENPE